MADYRINAMLGRNLTREPVQWPRNQGTGADANAPVSTPTASDVGISAKLNLGGAAIEGRLSAAFLGVVVLALTAFYVINRGREL